MRELSSLWGSRDTQFEPVYWRLHALVGYMQEFIGLERNEDRTDAVVFRVLYEMEIRRDPLTSPYFWWFLLWRVMKWDDIKFYGQEPLRETLKAYVTLDAQYLLKRCDRTFRRLTKKRVEEIILGGKFDDVMQMGIEIGAFTSRTRRLQLKRMPTSRLIEWYRSFKVKNKLEVGKCGEKLQAMTWSKNPRQSLREQRNS